MYDHAQRARGGGGGGSGDEGMALGKRTLVQQQRRPAGAAGYNDGGADLDAGDVDAGTGLEAGGLPDAGGQNIAGPVCVLPSASKPLNQALADLMTTEGMTAAQQSTVWTQVQQRIASATGTLYDAIGAAQRRVYDQLTAAEAAAGPASTAARTAMVASLTAELTRLHTELKAQIVRAAVDAVQGALGRTVACLADQVRAAVDNVLPPTAFGTIDFTTGTSRDVRHRTTTQFATYRTAVQTALQTIAVTTFAPMITADASGLHMEMLTAADHTTRMAGAGNRLDANHLHLRGASAADAQGMGWDLYQMQATSNAGNQLMRDLVAGTGQNFDVVLEAVNNDPLVGHDSFITNQVDLAEIRGEPAIAPANTTTLPQSQESVYAHFLNERRYDAMNQPGDLTALNTERIWLEAEQPALNAAFAALPPRIQSAINVVPVTPPLSPAEQTQMNAFMTRANAFVVRARAFQASFYGARLTPAHAYGVAQENAYNRERGFDDTRVN